MNNKKYLELLKKCLINEIYLENELRIYCLAEGKLFKNKLPWSRKIDFKKLHHIGHYFPDLLQEFKQKRESGYLLNVETQHLVYADSMIGRKRLDNIEHCLNVLQQESVPGDLIECGVWRGGASIFMKSYLEVNNINDRTVWLADSFAGLPASKLKQDLMIDLSANAFPGLAVSLQVVQSNFEKYEVSMEGVQFLQGWFKDTLPSAPIKEIALLRLDGDLYESTMDALHALYDKVSRGGFIIIDDYHALDPCKEAVNEFRAKNGIIEPLQTIDHEAVFWRKETDN